MAREKNSSFVGVPVRRADSGSPTFTRDLQEIAGDLALVHDMITGANSHASTDTVIHNGEAGRGALCGYPWINQYIGRSLSLSNSTGAKDGGPGDTNIYAVPIFFPEGDLTIELELFLTLAVDNRNAFNMRAVLTSTAMVEEDQAPFIFLDFPHGLTKARARLTASATGLYLLFVRMTTALDPPPGSSGTTDEIQIGTLHSVVGRVPRPSSGRRNGIPVTKPSRRTDSPFSVWSPSSTQGLGHRDFDATMFADLEAYHAWLTCGLDRNANSLYEYITGWPAGGNASYTHVDHDSGGSADSTDPARSRFFAHTRSLYSAEPELDMPFVCAGLGAFKENGGLVVDASATPSQGMLDWFAPMLHTDAARRVVSRLPVVWPDFQTSSSRLKCAVLVGSDAASDVTDWTCTINKAAGRTTLGAFSATDGTNTYWLATATAMTFSPDTSDTIDLEFQKTTGTIEAIDQCVPLGWCLYFDRA